MEWRVRRQDQDKVKSLAKALDCSPVFAWVLMNRGIATPEAAREFLAPSLAQLKPEQWMADADKAVARLARALERNEIIGVHGDYDVDGMTGSAIIISFLRELGARVVHYIPHREREGYGMKPRGVEELARQGASLIIAVDCGVNDREAVLHAGRLGLDVIVVDHHQVPQELPPALAVLNPHRPDCPFQGEELSAAGMAFYLAAALRAHLREKGRLEDNGPNLRRYLDLVALGTIADVVPVTGLNRVLVHFGMYEINKKSRPGIIQLLRVSGLLNREIGPGHASFQLAPRLNAAGRLEKGETGLRLLLAETEREAAALADRLNQLNRTRQAVEERILREALLQVERMPDPESAAALVVHGQGWHVGVVGIVASRIAEQFYKPVAVIGVNKGEGRGSLRSIPGVNVYRALTKCRQYLEQFGGHAQAAGITIKEENIEPFAEAFERAAAEVAKEGAFEPVRWLDAEWPACACDSRLARELEKLKPHGIGNPEPVFLARGLLVKWAREARNNTLLMGLEERDRVMRAVAFRMADRLPEFARTGAGARIDIAYTPVVDDWAANGIGDKPEGKSGPELPVKLMIKDFRPA